VEQFPSEDPYKSEIEYFARCIERREQPFLDFANSIANTELLEQIFKSAKPI
jgi:predicted dehydrogenase